MGHRDHRTGVVGRAIRSCAIAALAIGMPAQLTANPVLEWNEIARQMTVVPALSPVQQTRAMAIVHVAMHDAVAAITREYESYLPPVAAPAAGASPEAAAIAAAYRALRGVFGPSDTLDGRYAASLSARGIPETDPGVAVGEWVAARVLASRGNDGAATASYPYLPPGAGEPGVWAPVSTAPAAQALLPGWGNVTPWVLRSASQFRPDAPPALGSEAYVRDYEEVRRVGVASNATRTEEQTQMAFFWRASPTAIWNPALRGAIEARGLDLAASARTAALFYLAAADASVACWEAKYFYNYWRPQAAITQGDADGNPATAGDPAWRPLLPTPPHPEYPSGHTSNSGAMAFILIALFGDSPGYLVESAPAPGATPRVWSTFTEGVREAIDARVYSGIHFRTADDAGARLGRQVAQFVMTHALKRVRPADPRPLP